MTDGLIIKSYRNTTSFSVFFSPFMFHILQGGVAMLGSDNEEELDDDDENILVEESNRSDTNCDSEQE